MNHTAGNPERVRVPSASATWRVRFGKEARSDKRNGGDKPIGRVPRVARLLALAHRIDGMIRSGELKNWAEAAWMIGVTRARMTQIANLMLLAPGIQKSILDKSSVNVATGLCTERHLRAITKRALWKRQHAIMLND